MGHTLRRNLGPVQHLEPGEYTVETATGVPAVSCPECGGISDLTHSVLTGGVVSMLWPCPFESCAFADSLELEAWGEEVVR